MDKLLLIIQWILGILGIRNPMISNPKMLHAEHRNPELPEDRPVLGDVIAFAQSGGGKGTWTKPDLTKGETVVVVGSGGGAGSEEVTVVGGGGGGGLLTEPAPLPRVEVKTPAPPVINRALPPIEMDAKGILHGEGVTYVPSERIQRLVTSDGNVDGITWHWTDTRGVGAVALAKRTVKKAANVGSCHLWLDAKGQIAQSAPMLVGSWHAGYGFHFKKDANGIYKISDGYNANAYFCGVEIENIGEVRKTTYKGKEVWAGWPFNFLPETLKKYGAPTICPDDEVRAHPKNPARGWHKYTQAQRDGAERIVRALRGACALKRENCAWGHIQIDPERRTDPGPDWMGSVNNDGITVPKIGTQPGGILHDVLDTVFGK